MKWIYYSIFIVGAILLVNDYTTISGPMTREKAILLGDSPKGAQFKYEVAFHTFFFLSGFVVRAIYKRKMKNENP